MADDGRRRQHGSPAVTALLLAVMLALLAIPAEAAQDRAQYDWRQQAGAMVPPDVPVRDSTGTPRRLGSLFHGVPVILDLGYFTCRSLCGTVRGNLFDALARSGLQAGSDFEIAALSIDAAERPADAATARLRDVAAWPGMTGGLHYLTATQDAIDAVAAAVGFRADYDPRYREFLHPTGLVLLTGSGIVSGYVLGVGYSAGDVRAGLIRARSGGIARAALPILLLCFHYDQATGRYTLAIMKLLRLMAALTVVTILGVVVMLQRHRGHGAA